jgi:gluconokinase
VVLVMGVSGAGKTTVGRLLAEDLGWNFFDADEYHSPGNLDKLSRGLPLTDDDRRPWLDALRGAIRGWIDAGHRVVLACSALKAAYRDILLDGLDGRVRIVYLKGSYELIDQRLAHRTRHFMHRSLLADQFAVIEEPAGALVIDVADTPRRITDRIRSGLGL